MGMWEQSDSWDNPSGNAIFQSNSPNVMLLLRIHLLRLRLQREDFQIPRATIDPNFQGHNVPDTQHCRPWCYIELVPYDDCPDRYNKYCDDIHDLDKKHCGS